MSDLYPIRRLGQHRLLPVRQLQYHLTQWGQPRPQQPLLVMMHGTWTWGRPTSSSSMR